MYVRVCFLRSRVRDRKRNVLESPRMRYAERDPRVYLRPNFLPFFFRLDEKPRKVENRTMGASDTYHPRIRIADLSISGNDDREYTTNVSRDSRELQRKNKYPTRFKLFRDSLRLIVVPRRCLLRIIHAESRRDPRENMPIDSTFRTNRLSLCFA